MCPLSGPGDIASVPTKKSFSNKTSQNNETDALSFAKQMPRSIEEFDDLQEFEENSLESRKRPEYSISYKQSVTPQDVYLQV